MFGLTDLTSTVEEFGIYLNYVRKLGFEENPDYDFLRELFAKVLKNQGETDDGIFDWMLLNNGKGWEASAVGDLCLWGRANTDFNARRPLTSFKYLIEVTVSRGNTGHLVWPNHSQGKASFCLLHQRLHGTAPSSGQTVSPRVQGQTRRPCRW